jgi:ketosteroid isomerase-like protein
MHSEETRAVLVTFYDALSRRDGGTMASCYAPNASFDDEVFALSGADVGKMWRNLMVRAKTLKVSYTIGKVQIDKGTVEWTARYDYDGRPIVNVILSELELRDGKIIKQVDKFDFPRWAAQAFGWKGKLFGNFAWFRRKVSIEAAKRLGVRPKL